MSGSEMVRRRSVAAGLQELDGAPTVPPDSSEISGIDSGIHDLGIIPSGDGMFLVPERLTREQLPDSTPDSPRSPVIIKRTTTTTDVYEIGGADGISNEQLFGTFNLSTPPPAARQAKSIELASETASTQKLTKHEKTILPKYLEHIARSTGRLALVTTIGLGVGFFPCRWVVETFSIGGASFSTNDYIDGITGIAENVGSFVGDHVLSGGK